MMIRVAGKLRRSIARASSTNTLSDCFVFVRESLREAHRDGTSHTHTHTHTHTPLYTTSLPTMRSNRRPSSCCVSVQSNSTTSHEFAPLSRQLLFSNDKFSLSVMQTVAR